MDTTWAIPVLLSHELWRGRFGGDRNIIGRTITLSDLSRLVVGVLPADFAFPRVETQVWMLLAPSQANARFVDTLDYQAIGRLRAGATPASAGRELRQILPAIKDSYPDATAQRMAQVQLTPMVTSLKDVVIGDIGAKLWLLFGGMMCVMLVASTNVANLSILHADQRSGEIALRTALGARSADVLRLLLSEAFLLSAAGTVLGLGLADAALKATVMFAPVRFPRSTEIGLDGWVLAVTAGIGLLAAVFCGVLAFVTQFGGSEISAALKGHRLSGTSNRGRIRTRRMFVAVQVALALPLLIASALMAQSFWRLTHVNPGFEPGALLTVEVGLPRTRVGQNPQIVNGLLERVRQVPGVRSAAAASSLPLDGGAEAYPLVVADRAPSQGDQAVAIKFVTPEYFAVMKTISGRGHRPRCDGARPLAESGGVECRVGSPALFEQGRSWEPGQAASA